MPPPDHWLMIPQ